jgi:hypothetical protein
MNAQRFKDLADAYGADLRRWPEAEKPAARAFVDADRPGAERLLFEGRQIDLALDVAPRPVVSHALREQVIAIAATAGLKPRARFVFGRLAWASGAGWAAASVAGVLVGLNLSQPAVARAEADAVLYQAGLLALDDTEVLG